MKETLKIRHYVVGMIYHAGERSVQIMSSRNLAEHFGMARSTVSIALKELVEEGYLIPVKGKGNFTNPRKMMTPFPGKMPPLILLIHNDGRSFYYGSQEWESISTIGKAVTDAGYYFRQLTLTSTKEEELFEEIRGAQGDGLIWVDRLTYSESLLRRLSDSGLPVICDDRRIRSVNSVVFDTASACRKIGRRLAQDRKANILYALGDWYRENDLPSIQKGFFECCGSPMNIAFADVPEEMTQPDQLYHALLRKKWDAVFTYPQRLPLLQSACRQLGIEMPEPLFRLHLRNTPEGAEEFYFPFRERAETTVQRMTELLNGDREIKQILVPMELIRYQSQQKEIAANG